MVFWVNLTFLKILSIDLLVTLDHFHPHLQRSDALEAMTFGWIEHSFSQDWEIIMSIHRELISLPNIDVSSPWHILLFNLIVSYCIFLSWFPSFFLHEQSMQNLSSSDGVFFFHGAFKEVMYGTVWNVPTKRDRSWIITRKISVPVNMKVLT
jgi:hypothetical protein